MHCPGPGVYCPGSGVVEWTALDWEWYRDCPGSGVVGWTALDQECTALDREWTALDWEGYGRLPWTGSGTADCPGPGVDCPGLGVIRVDCIGPGGVGRTALDREWTALDREWYGGLQHKNQMHHPDPKVVWAMTRLAGQYPLCQRPCCPTLNSRTRALHYSGTRRPPGLAVHIDDGRQLIAIQA